MILLLLQYCVTRREITRLVKRRRGETRRGKNDDADDEGKKTVRKMQINPRHERN